MSGVGVTAGFEALPGWAQDDHLAAFDAFRLSAGQGLKKPYRDGSDGRTFAAMKPVFAAAIGATIHTRQEARAFFESWFQPVALDADGKPHGHVTGFYEPVVKGSRTRTADFPVPLFRQPDDLVEIDDASRPPDIDPYFRFARKTDKGLEEYCDRGAIERGALDGKGLELVFVANRVEAFFIHVQGAARIELPDGSVMGITYSAKTGHPFTGPGRILVDRGEIARSAISMQSIRQWLHDHPEKADELLWQNRSFIFFRESPVDNPGLGPVAAAKVQLIGGRSMAVDRLRHVFGSLVYVASEKVSFGDGKPFRRLMVAQDTGSAIVGTARGDLFTGSGFEAGEIAGRINAEADFWLLWPKAALGDLK